MRNPEPTDVDADLLVVGLHEGEELPAGLRDAPGAADASADFKKLSLVHPERPSRALVVGLGKPDATDAERVRVAAALAVKEAGRLRARLLAWLPPAVGDEQATAAALVTGTILGAYRFDRFRGSDPDDPAPPRVDSLTLLGPESLATGCRRSPRLRRGAEPRPRPAEPALERRHPVLPGRPCRGDRRGQRRDRRRGAGARRDRRQGHGRPGRRQPGQRGGAEADRAALLGRRLGTDPGPGRQGRHLRHRRHLAEAVGVDARDEDGHVRRRRGAGGGRRRSPSWDSRSTWSRSSPRRRTCRPGPRSSPATSSPSTTG